MKGYILKNATIITASKEAVGTVIVNDGIIADVIYNEGEGYEEKVTFLGDGVPVYQSQLKEGLQVSYSFAPAHQNRQRAAAVGTLAMQYYREGKIESAVEHKPDYLRLSQAERERAEKDGNPS